MHQLSQEFASLSDSNVSKTSPKWSSPLSIPSAHFTSSLLTRIDDYDLKTSMPMELFAYAQSSLCMPVAYAGNAAAGTIGAHTVAYKKFKEQQRVKADLTPPFVLASATVTLNETNSKHQFGTGSLAPLDLVKELKAMFGNITKQEIDATQALISAPLGHFLDFRDFCSNIYLNYEFLTSAGHTIPELIRIDSFIHSIQPYTQFDAYLINYLDYS